MAKGKNDGGNKYARRLKNPELIGKGEKQTQEQILQKGAKPTIEQKVQEIKAQQAQKEKGQ
jgi:hypothetical protein